MKKSVTSISVLLAMPINNFFRDELPVAMETRGERTLRTLATKSIIEDYYGGTGVCVGKTIEMLLSLEPSKIRLECVLNGGSYGEKSHTILKDFFVLNGISDKKKYPFLNELGKDDSLPNLRKNLSRRSIENLAEELDPHGEFFKGEHGGELVG